MHSQGSNRKQLTRSLVILAAVAGGSYWAGTQTAQWWQQDDQRTAMTPAAHFHKLDRFVISIPGEQYQHYVQLELAIKSESAEFSDVLTQAEPLVRNGLMHLFSKKHYEELSQLQDLNGLQNEVKVLLADTLQRNGYPNQIDEVLFTRLVVQ
ncbi:flagellar basal body-associated protein FliL [Ferrimonas balearica DSM 9799]|uniref:Flagellar protein FliL n=1 Tax=Ferrimonas balearica (strain DSM 9799 / CCM 4581 / KCTC 23876 / PAT) TaxID=550540 RepID=E1SLD7_FERBD|nr:flagellar basal body-associated FliL family protein [Ferrimonas balearica]ADN76501.1 flagellar basal body-associated protein FliL [Ferrimonas balearica DSM 9799]